MEEMGQELCLGSAGLTQEGRRARTRTSQTRDLSLPASAAVSPCGDGES